MRVYDLTNFNAAVAQKTFYKADRVQLLWNNLGNFLLILMAGTHILVVTQTETDKTGKSYYGENNLYYIATAGNYDCRVILGKLFIITYCR